MTASALGSALGGDGRALERIERDVDLGGRPASRPSRRYRASAPRRARPRRSRRCRRWRAMLSAVRMASTAAWSAAFSSPRPISCEAASAAASVTRTASSARLRSILPCLGHRFLRRRLCAAPSAQKCLDADQAGPSAHRASALAMRCQARAASPPLPSRAWSAPPAPRPDCDRPRWSIDSSEMRSSAQRRGDTAAITPGRSCTIRRM